MAQEQQQAASEPVKASEQSSTVEAQGTSAQGTSITRGESQKGEIERPRHGALGRSELFTSPFAFMQRMMNEMDRMFSRVGFGGGITIPSAFEVVGEQIWSPVIETFERDGKLVLRAELPGLEQKDVNVEVEGDELVISGCRKHEEESSSGGRFYSERRYGSFERRLTLPVDVDPEQIQACFENGVLEVSLKIPEEKAKTKKVEVKSGKQEGSPRSVH
jgi:HSP20 family protein